MYNKAIKFIGIKVNGVFIHMPVNKEIFKGLRLPRKRKKQLQNTGHEIYLDCFGSIGLLVIKDKNNRKL